MHQQNAFGIAGCPRCVDQFGDVLRFRTLRCNRFCSAFLLERGHGIVTIGLDDKDVFERRDIFWKIFYLFIYCRIGNKENFCPAVVNDVFPDLNQFCFVHGHVTGQASPGGKPDYRPFRAVVGNDADDIIFADSQLGQSRSKVVNAVADFFVGRPFINAFFVFGAEQRSIGKPGYAFSPPIDQIVGLVQCEFVHKILLVVWSRGR